MTPTPPPAGRNWTETTTGIDTMIRCPKVVSSTIKTADGDERGHSRIDFAAETPDGTHRFLIFARQNVEFDENFSIGLIYIDSRTNAQLQLIRMNGPHGAQESIKKSLPHHYVCHIHMTTPELLAGHRGLGRECCETDAYITYIEAIAYFLKYCGITGADEKLGIDRLQPSLPFGGKNG